MFLPMSWTSPLTVAMTIRPFGSRPRPGSLLGLDERDEVGDGLLHDPGALDDLGQEHLAGAEQVADDVHAVHQRPLDDLDRAVGGEPRLLGVLDDEGVDALDERVGQALVTGSDAPGEGVAAGAARALVAGVAVGDGEQPLGGVGAAVQHEVLDELAQLGLDVVVDRQRAGVDDAHVHPGPDRVVQEDRVDRLADRVVAAERERDVGHAARDQRARAARP